MIFCKISAVLLWYTARSGEGPSAIQRKKQGNIAKTMGKLPDWQVAQ
jgi:hypothetical protein